MQSITILQYGLLRRRKLLLVIINEGCISIELKCNIPTIREVIVQAISIAISQHNDL